MNRTASLALLVLVVATTGIIVPVVAAQPSPHVAADTTAGSPQPASTNATESSVAPGTRLSGALSAHGAEINGEVSVRAFDRAYENAESNRSKAAVVAAQTAQLDDRLDALSARLDALHAARANGSISERAHTARVTATVAQIRQTRRLANVTVVAAADLPPSARATAGVDVLAVRELSARASNLTGSEVAAVARSIAGEQTDRGYGSDAITRHRAEAAVTRADVRVTQAARLLHAATSLPDATLAAARDELTAANHSRNKAHDALRDGQYADAIAFAADAEAHARAAIRVLRGDRGGLRTGNTSVDGNLTGTLDGTANPLPLPNTTDANRSDATTSHSPLPLTETSTTPTTGVSASTTVRPA